MLYIPCISKMYNKCVCKYVYAHILFSREPVVFSELYICGTQLIPIKAAKALIGFSCHDGY